MAPTKKAAMQGGGCGCANATQQGGSLASSAVVELVSDHAWASMDDQFTNLVGEQQQQQQQQQGGGGSGMESALGSVVQLLKLPVHGGSPASLDSMISSNLTGSLKKKYATTVKKYSAKKHNGGSAEALDHVENLTSFLSPNFTGVVSKLIMSGGSGMKSFELNSFLDHLTLPGARKLGELFADNKLFKSGTSIAAYARSAVDFVPSKHTKAIAKTMAAQHGGRALDMLSSLSAANLDKVSALIGGKSAMSSLSSFFEGHGVSVAKKVQTKTKKPAAEKKPKSSSAKPKSADAKKKAPQA